MSWEDMVKNFFHRQNKDLRWEDQTEKVKEQYRRLYAEDLEKEYYSNDEEQYLLNACRSLES